MTNNQVTYWDYLKVVELLDLQNGLEQDEENISEDEMHFIIVHQVFELWFKLTLKELRLARDKMNAQYVEEETVPYVVHRLKRINKIIDIAAKHFELMETLTPQDFLEFRSKLGTASGFQSFQLREVEFLMGLEQDQRDSQDHGDPAKYIIETADKSEHGEKIVNRLKKAREESSLREAIHTWLFRTPIHGSTPKDEDDDQVVSEFIENYLQIIKDMNEKQLKQLLMEGGDEEVLKKRFEATLQNARNFLLALDVDEEDRKRNSRIRASILFIESYRELPLLAWPRRLIDCIVEMEEKFLGFRFHHARMVERIIGRRVGTGGSSGVDYLDETLEYRIFPELWEVRTLLLSSEKLPKLQNPEFYRFASDLNE